MSTEYRVGPPGVPGPRGRDGSRWYCGGEEPEQALGYNGDFFLCTADCGVWEKSEGNWTRRGSLRGSQGAEGISAYDAAVDGGYTGTEEDFSGALAALAEGCVPLREVTVASAGTQAVEISTDTLGAELSLCSLQLFVDFAAGEAGMADFRVFFSEQTSVLMSLPGLVSVTEPKSALLCARSEQGIWSITCDGRDGQHRRVTEHFDAGDYPVVRKLRLSVQSGELPIGTKLRLFAARRGYEA